MGLFKRNRIKEVEACVVEESMWNIFTKAPWLVVDLRQGWHYRKWSRLDAPLAELVWKTLSEVWEEVYFQYVWLFRNGAEIDDASNKLFIFDGFIYNGVKCKHVIVSSRKCNEFEMCRALMLKSPSDTVKKLWHLYQIYEAKKVQSA
jgi:hypothetical protein